MQFSLGLVLHYTHLNHKPNYYINEVYVLHSRTHIQDHYFRLHICVSSHSCAASQTEKSTIFGPLRPFQLHWNRKWSLKAKWVGFFVCGLYTQHSMLAPPLDSPCFSLLTVPAAGCSEIPLWSLMCLTGNLITLLAQHLQFLPRPSHPFRLQNFSNEWITMASFIEQAVRNSNRKWPKKSQEAC